MEKRYVKYVWLLSVVTWTLQLLQWCLWVWAFPTESEIQEGVYQTQTVSTVSLYPCISARWGTTGLGAGVLDFVQACLSVNLWLTAPFVSPLTIQRFMALAMENSSWTLHFRVFKYGYYFDFFHRLKYKEKHFKSGC